MNELYNVCIFPTSNILGEAREFDNLFVAVISNALNTHRSLNVCFKVTDSEVPTREVYPTRENELLLLVTRLRNSKGKI